MAQKGITLASAFSARLSHALPEQLISRGSTMKKNEFSEVASNLLIFGSVSLAFTPFILGDRLVVVVADLMREGAILVMQVNNYVSWLLS